jgi:hypothetical protein
MTAPPVEEAEAMAKYSGKVRDHLYKERRKRRERREDKEDKVSIEHWVRVSVPRRLMGVACSGLMIDEERDRPEAGAAVGEGGAGVDRLAVDG